MNARSNRGWSIVAVALLFQAVSTGTIISSFALFLPLWSHDFGISRSVTTLFLTVAVILSGFAALVIGPLFDRVSVKLTVLFGCLLYIASFLLLSAAQQPWQLFVIFSIVLAFTFVLLDSLPGQVLVARWFGTNASVPLSIVSSGQAIGGVLMPPLVALLIKATGSWRGATPVLAVIMAVAIVPLIVLVVRDRPAGTQTPDAARAHHPEALAGGGRIASDPRFVWTMLATIPLLMMTTAFQTNLGVITLAKGGSLTTTSFDIAILNAVGFASTISAGWMLARISHRMLIQVGGALAACGILGFYLSSDPVLDMVFCGLIGLGAGPTASVLASYFCAVFTPARMGTTMGLAHMTSRVVILAPLAFAFISEHSGDFRASLLGLSALGVLTILCARNMPNVEARPGEPAWDDAPTAQDLGYVPEPSA